MQFWIASYPRSGNTFLRILLRNRFGIVSSPPPSRRPATETIADSAFFQPYHRDANAVAGLEGAKTHALPVPGDTQPAVYIIRDGRDSLLSYAYHTLNFIQNKSLDEITTGELLSTLRNLIIERNSPYKTWSENVEAWLVREHTLIIRFEELVAEPSRVADRVVSFLDASIPVQSEAIPSFGELKSSDPRFFRSGRRGQWPEVFTPELHALFWKHNGSTMTRLGYRPGPPLKASA
jgi:hypothetical protein